MGFSRTECRPRETIATSRDNDDDGEDSLRSYEPIDVLQDAGINTADIAKLKNDGFATIGQLFQVSQKRLLGVKGISEAKMGKVLYCLTLRSNC
ncbi:hypothetical protein V7S43_000013 [Phytophthora oleae]|uniref:DNA recombination and repair protein Rad51-like C-terminal domain-containing protein n=1 Tax=Phytophthora oleae TaxID=2107226 RepID=A0ABD3G5V9_9STRA